RKFGRSYHATRGCQPKDVWRSVFRTEGRSPSTLNAQFWPGSCKIDTGDHLCSRPVGKVGIKSKSVPDPEHLRFQGARRLRYNPPFLFVSTEEAKSWCAFVA